MIIVDTNVLSEMMRAEPSDLVFTWLENACVGELAMTATSVMEITYGVSRMPEGRRKAATQECWLALQGSWEGLFLPFGMLESHTAGRVMAARASVGRPTSYADAQIAGTALVHGAAIATRNTKDFDGLGIDLVDPWQ